MNATTAAAPRTIVDELEQFFSRFVAVSPGLSLVLALWSLATHVHERFDAFPYLAITSPTKRCGKTRACELIGLVCLKPLPTVSISPAALYRTVQAGKRTLLIDEAEYLGRTKDDRASILREILNAGYRKGQVVSRCKRVSKSKGKNESHESYEPEQFETFCPKVIVLIGRLQDTLADRCIEVRMERRRAQLERFRYARVQAETAPLRQAAEEWAQRNGAAVEHHYQEHDVPFLRDREAELWLPLFSTCAIAAPNRLADLEVIAKCQSDAKADDEPGDIGIQLLKDVRQVFGQEERLPTAALLELLNALTESPWAGWFHGKGLDSHALARRLRPFGVQSQNIRMGEQVVKGYLRQSFADCWERYL
jgi:hypothetical protein